MSIGKAKEIYKNVLKSASKFLSPSYKEFFITKANQSYEGFAKNPNQSKDSISKYIEEQNQLKEVLDRSSLIYNMYRDESSTL